MYIIEINKSQFEERLTLKETIGVIGLGNMGSIIAKKLSKDYRVIGFDIDENKLAELEKEGISCETTLEGLAQKVNRVVVSLPNGEISKSVLTTIIPSLQSDTIIIETSTILPNDILSINKVCEQHDVKFIDAAILGGLSHVAEGNAKLLVGGSTETTDAVHDILLTIGKEIIKVGDLGSGMSAKIINNGIAHNVMVLIAEACSIGVKVGIDPEMMYELLGNETAFERPVEHRYKERMLNGDFEGGMSNLNARKDSMLALELAQQMNVPLFSIQASHTVYDIAVQEGLGNLDYASVSSLWEKWCDISFDTSK